MIEPHGHRLVDRMAPSQGVDSYPEDCPRIRLSHRHYQDLLNIATGRFSPLDGFLTRNDFLKVVHDMTLEDGTLWPLPIVLDVDKEKASELEPDKDALLCDPSGKPVASLQVTEVYKYNKEESAHAVFGTEDEDHPGVRNFLEQDDFLVGGPVQLFEYERYNGADLPPAESRVLFNHYDWDTVVGFQTRNAPHRAHEYIQKSALEFTDGLLVQPKLGAKKKGDYEDHVILKAYNELVDRYYPEGSVTMAVFPSRMRYAGPREAVFDALVRKNQGCTHFIIGRDHAGVGDYYGGFDAHRIFDRIDDIGIEPMFFSYSFYCEACDGMASEKVCPHDDDDRHYPSGTKIRNLIQSGEVPPEKIMRPEVAEKIINAESQFVDT